MIKWKNAKIVNTFIGIEDHGIFAWNIVFSGNGWGQGTGIYSIDTSALPILEKIVRLFGPWEELKDKFVQIGREEDRGLIIGIRDILDETKEVRLR